MSSIRKKLGLKKEYEGSNESQHGDVVIFGAQRVGKTSITERFAHNYFTECYNQTYNEARYDVEALIETEEDVGREGRSNSLVLKKSFKKSVMGKSRPKAPRKSTVKRVVSISGRKPGQYQNQASTGHKFKEGMERGMKRLKFTLVDTPSDVSEMAPMTYRALIANGGGFFVVCSFDEAESLTYAEDRVEDIRTAKADSIHSTPIILIANKSDIPEEERVIDELAINTLAAQLKLKYCCAAASSEEGCAEMSGFLLTEINVSAEEREYEDSLPEMFAYH